MGLCLPVNNLTVSMLQFRNCDASKIWEWEFLSGFYWTISKIKCPVCVFGFYCITVFQCLAFFVSVVIEEGQDAEEPKSEPCCRQMEV